MFMCDMLLDCFAELQTLSSASNRWIARRHIAPPCCNTLLVHAHTSKNICKVLKARFAPARHATATSKCWQPGLLCKGQASN